MKKRGDYLIHPEDGVVHNTSGKKGNILMALLLFVVVASIACYAYLKSHNLDIRDLDLKSLLGIGQTEQKLLQENIIEIAYDSKEHPIFNAYKDYIVKCNKDGVWFLDKKGREVWSLGTPFNKPIVKSNGTYLLVADLGGKDIYILDGKSVFWNDKTEESILNAEISGDGYVTAITSSEHYNGEVRVYDNHGIELFRRVIANEFAVAAQISPSNEKMVINLINPTGIKSNTLFKFFDMYGLNREELKSVQMPSDKGLYPLMWFTGSGSLFAASDSSLLYMDKNGDIKWDKTFKSVSSVCMTSSKRLVAALDDNGSYFLKVFSSNGQEYSSLPLESGVLDISAFGGIFAVNSVREVDFYTERCRHLGKYVSKSDVEYVIFFSRNQALIVTRNNLVVVEI